MPKQAAKKSAKRSKARAPLSRERVIRAAIAMVDKAGLDALSMRRVGEVLGVEAMSLYRHVTNRDDILDGIVDMVVGEIALPTEAANWKTAMRQRAISARAVLLRHPWAATLMESRTSISPARLQYADAILGSLRRAGFPIAIAYRAFLILDSYIYGFVLQEVNWPYPADELPEVVARVGPHAAPYVNVTEVMAQVMKERAARAADSKTKNELPYSSEFEFGLDLVLDGFERLLPR